MAGTDAEHARRARLAAALRENLKRRRAQSHGRAALAEAAPDHAAAGTIVEPDRDVDNPLAASGTSEK